MKKLLLVCLFALEGCTFTFAHTSDLAWADRGEYRVRYVIARGVVESDVRPLDGGDWAPLVKYQDAVSQWHCMVLQGNGMYLEYHQYFHHGVEYWIHPLSWELRPTVGTKNPRHWLP